MEQTYSRYFFLKTVSISNAHLKYYSKNISSGINSQSKNRMMAGNFQYFKNFTYEYLLYLRKAFKKMTKSWLKTEDGEFQTNPEPLICKKKKKKEENKQDMSAEQEWLAWQWDGFPPIDNNPDFYYIWLNFLRRRKHLCTQTLHKFWVMSGVR